MVGPLNAKDSQPLPNELEAFVNNSDHGFIVVSFGSNVGFLAKEKVDMMAIAFGKLKQKVVWRLKGKLKFGKLSGFYYYTGKPVQNTDYW